MKKLLLLVVCAIAAAWYFGFVQPLVSSSEHCSPAYIAQIADDKGLEKARDLAADCAEEGFSGAKNALRDAGESVSRAVRDAEKKLLGN